MKIENRTFVVSGGRSGLGLATIHELLACKAYVALLDLSPASVSDNLSSEEKTALKRVKFIKTDVTSLQEIENAVKETVEWTKQTGARLGGVVNCAGIAVNELFLSPKGARHSAALFDKMMRVNVFGTFHLSNYIAEQLAKVEPEDTEDKERGVIIMVSSDAAFEGQPSQSVYSASKGAIRSLTLPLARELARHHIRVVSIAPGLFTTPLTSPLPQSVHEKIHRRGLLYPKRFGSMEEFAATVKWILECGYVNGETIRINGGQRIPAFL